MTKPFRRRFYRHYLLKDIIGLPPGHKEDALRKRIDLCMAARDRCKKEGRNGGADWYLAEADTFAHCLAVLTHFYGAKTNV